jgi:hypothetical protein
MNLFCKINVFVIFVFYITLITYGLEILLFDYEKSYYIYVIESLISVVELIYEYLSAIHTVLTFVIKS